MARPDIQGKVIDDVGAEANGGGDELNGAENEIDPQNGDSLNEPEGEPNVDGGGTDPETGEEIGKVEGAEGEEGANPEPGPGTENLTLDQVRDQLRQELRDEIMTELKQQQVQKEPAKEISEEEWNKHESEWGIPRSAIKNVVSRMERVVMHVMNKMDERFSRFEKGDALRSLGQQPGFNDAARYAKDVDEFLSHYDVKHHSNPELLKRAVIYARGKNMKSTVQRAAQGAERNRRIAGVARPAGSAGPIGKGMVGKRQLSAIERSAARAAGMSDDEYLKHKGAKRVLA